MMNETLDLFPEEKGYVKGMPHHIVFRNDDNAYTVLRVYIQETNEAIESKDIAIFGYFPVIHLHESYQFFGQLKKHPKYGQQYEVIQFRKLLPQSKDGIVQYLSGELFPGIGQTTAERVVSHLGEGAISKILNHPEVLGEVPKLPEDKAVQIAETLLAHEGLEKVLIALSDYGFGTQLSTKIYQTYGNEAVNVIENNPYQLVQDIEGVGFQRADELGRRLGLVGDHPERIQAGYLYWLNEKAMNEGHVYMPFEETLTGIQTLLTTGKAEEVSTQSIEKEINTLEEEGIVVVEEEHIYLPSLYFAEKGIVTSIKKLSEQTVFESEFSESEFLEALGGLEERLTIQYASSQKEAIQKAIQSPLMLLTGGPGTGKTTVIKGIVEIFAELHGLSLNEKDYNQDNPYPFILAAPTGRAAKRMSESTGLPAVTIHRLLGWRGGSGFDHDEEQPIEGKLLIIDEMSMVDLWLANQLFKSLPLPMQVIVVGDEDQLPSVGPGQVLDDFLHSDMIPTVRLTDIYRQSEGSSIIELAHEMKKGQLPKDIAKPTEDRRFFSCHQNQIVEVVSKVYKNAVKNGYTPMDIQVLVPIYRGNAGIDVMNQALQELLNPESEQKRTLVFGDNLYRTGDKVLQLVNNPEQGIFNGDIGEVVAIFRAKETTEKEDQLVVSFDGKEIVLLKRDLNQITLAYCCSIHKSQGSEFPIVILPIVKGYHRMLRRNLIYTAVTRSKAFLILCGDEQTLAYSIQQTDSGARHSALKDKLVERLQSVDDEDDDWENILMSNESEV